MEIKNAFEVAAPIDHVWTYMLDVTKVAPCMPGAELTETVDDTTWKGNVTVRLGPVKMGFGGTVVMTERDDQITQTRSSRRARDRPPVDQHQPGGAQPDRSADAEPAAGLT